MNVHSPSLVFQMVTSLVALSIGRVSVATCVATSLWKPVLFVYSKMDTAALDTSDVPYVRLLAAARHTEDEKRRQRLSHMQRLRNTQAVLLYNCYLQKF